MTVYNFRLLCRACGETQDRQLTQFDELPNCPKCDSEMLVDAVTPAAEIANIGGQKIE